MNTTPSKECQHELQSLPPVDLRSVQYVCTVCETFFDVGVDHSSETVGWSMADMHTKIVRDLGYTYIGETTYERLRERSQGEK